MLLGVNVPNFGPGTGPAVLERWAKTVEGLGYGLLMLSDHVVITPDVAGQYPKPFFEPMTTLAWLAGITRHVKLGTTVLIMPYRHPLLVARMAANLHQLSGGRLVLGVASGWARQEFAALGVPFERRGALTDEYLDALRAAWADEDDYGRCDVPIWIGGNSEAGMRRAIRHDAAWHPLRRTPGDLRAAADRLRAIAAEQRRPVPELVPRIVLRPTPEPVTAPGRLAGEGSIEQIVADLDELRLLGARTVVLDPFWGDPEETRHPEAAWQALAAVAAAYPLDRGVPDA
ncbi:LLM class flavin-dependent oxidoreductase [Nonomuraea sp. NN258]|uniref:LLM class flavin-dependent oxidoreductase n=1 Tax=Nonomuraea antri TaxID=2730852 RepID=UPI00156A1A55|nr:LLM class flavin-dependent oxidoreductase [Nonomuraea antri]NRQ37736.1 LLM class flavin-dependent oxidoreductase [Nonomuraea antri]